MNTSVQFRSPSLATPALARPTVTVIPDVRSQATSSKTIRPRKPASLSANQLMAVELGLYLLSNLQPTASPTSLPDILAGTPTHLQNQPVWTPKQHRYLNRARLLIGQFLQPALWHSLLERYAYLPEHLQAYDISQDRLRFGEKKVGFSRNRLFTLKRLFD